MTAVAACEFVLFSITTQFGKGPISIPMSAIAQKRATRRYEIEYQAFTSLHLSQDRRSNVLPSSIILLISCRLIRWLTNFVSSLTAETREDEGTTILSNIGTTHPTTQRRIAQDFNPASHPVMSHFSLYEGNSISKLQIVIEKNRMEIMTY